MTVVEGYFYSEWRKDSSGTAWKAAWIGIGEECKVEGVVCQECDFCKQDGESVYEVGCCYSHGDIPGMSLVCCLLFFNTKQGDYQNGILVIL